MTDQVTDATVGTAGGGEAAPAEGTPATAVNQPSSGGNITPEAAREAGVLQWDAPEAGKGTEVADGTADVKSTPESYGEFTLPEDVVALDSYLDEFTELAKENGWTKEQAQAVLDFNVRDYQRTQEADATEWNDLQTEWQTASAKDPEIGGGSKEAFQENIAIANKAVEAFGGEALAEALLDTGAGNHPEVVRFFLKVGRAMSEDLTNNSSAQQQRDDGPEIGDVFFPKSNMK